MTTRGDKIRALAHNHMQALLDVLDAAQLVIDRWERGDLAVAVNSLRLDLEVLK